jgi:hypothetical protein
VHSGVAVIVAIVFLVLACWHVVMAFSDLGSASAAVPSAGGKPLFKPSRRSTLLVALVLTGFAGLVACTAGWVDVGLSARVLSWLSYALALGLAARAVGEFRYVGFFKRERGSRFATMDTLVYSPLCLLLAAGVALVASGNALA